MACESFFLNCLDEIVLTINIFHIFTRYLFIYLLSYKVKQTSIYQVEIQTPNLCDLTIIYFNCTEIYL